MSSENNSGKIGVGSIVPQFSPVQTSIDPSNERATDEIHRGNTPDVRRNATDQLKNLIASPTKQQMIITTERVVQDNRLDQIGSVHTIHVVRLQIKYYFHGNS